MKWQIEKLKLDKMGILKMTLGKMEFDEMAS
jgi:hypothetical protein